MPRIFAVSLLLLWLGTATAEPWLGRVVAVIDGDTIGVLHDGREERIRLADIDAPEKGQPYGQASKQALSELVFNREVLIEPRSTDRYGRTVARVRLGEVNVEAEQVRLGLAWYYLRYGQDPPLIALEQSARAAQRGLWAEPSPCPPWDWRHRGRCSHH